MMKERDIDGRGRPAHLPNVARFNTPVILFVTVCAADRASNTFANETMHWILREAWGAASSHKVGAYVLMPDHMHLFCAPAKPDAENVAKWVRYWKSLVTRVVRGRPVGGASVGLPGSADEQTLVPPGSATGRAERGGASVGLPCRISAGLLGHAVTTRRELPRQMGVRAEQPSSTRVGRLRRGMTVLGHCERTRLVSEAARTSRRSSLLVLRRDVRNEKWQASACPYRSDEQTRVLQFVEL